MSSGIPSPAPFASAVLGESGGLDPERDTLRLFDFVEENALLAELTPWFRARSLTGDVE